MPNNLKHIRARAFTCQDGRCIYCGKPMWLSDPAQFATRQNLTLKQTLHFQCTSEHLLARKDGGGNAAANIAAACRFCNGQRHKRKQAMTPEHFTAFVRKRVGHGRWNA